MAVISIGSGGRVGVPELRLPPGQRLVDDWPVLTAGLTTDVGAHEWTISITTEAGHRVPTGFERAPLRGATAVTQEAAEFCEQISHEHSSTGESARGNREG